MTASARPVLHRLAVAELLERLRNRLSGWVPGDEDLRIGPFPAAEAARVRHLFPAEPRRAAVLIPLIEREDDLHVLLTYRAADLDHHAGQISFPGGRLEPGDPDPETGALRETEEEIGLSRAFVEVLGRLPDHVVITGFRVTPVVGLVRPGFSLHPEPDEVSRVFEAPLRHLFDPGTHTPRVYRVGNEELTSYDLPWQEHRIWGATAGMLLTLKEVLEE